MSSNRIILYDGKFEAEQAEQELLEHRSNILQGLESARLAMVQFLGKEMEYSDLEPFIKQTKADERKEMALKLWLQVTNQTVPKMFVKLSSAILTPPEVTKLLEGIAKMDGWPSEDPKRYWNEKSKVFEAIPVSKEDRDIMIERSREYCAPGVDPTFSLFVHQFIRFINLGNSKFTRYGGGTKSHKEDFPEFLRPLVQEKKHRMSENGTENYYTEYRLKPGMFTLKGDWKFAFDEFKSIQVVKQSDKFIDLKYN